MSEPANNDDSSSGDPLKPVRECNSDVIFPPFPDPTDQDFDEDITQEERDHYVNKFKDIHSITQIRIHCTACDRHLGCAARNESRMRVHPMLKTLVCQACHSFYNSGEFDKGDDGSELYCRWCGQGGQVYCCSQCPHVFCAKCIKRNLGPQKIKEIENNDDWQCFKCKPRCMWDLRSICWAVLRYCDVKNKIAYSTQDQTLKDAYQKDCGIDYTVCCKNKLRRKEKTEAKKKEHDKKKDESSKKIKDENSKKDPAAAVISKIPPTIQVKKFAAINNDDSTKAEKKSGKRPLSPAGFQAVYMKNPLPIIPPTKVYTPRTPPAKKLKDNEPMKGSYRYCIVPVCNNTSKNAPNKVFFLIPRGEKIREEWCKIIKREMISPTAALYCCEDHFDLEADTENYMQYKIMNLQENYNTILRLKRGIFPHKFLWQNSRLVQNTQSQLETQHCKKRRHSEITENDLSAPSVKQSVLPSACTTFNPGYAPRVFQPEKRSPMSFPRIRPKQTIMPVPSMSNLFNGYSFQNIATDNINLSLDSLTQGLDMANVGRMANSTMNDDDVVCTPDFPLEPLCEVTEDNTDDDVQCITPAPLVAAKSNPPPLTPIANLDALDNIVQMTENDVTVNAATGGLKFRVDPQTLSANKMYRLPDGRIFAINPNPSMPGGYSATIVAVTDTGACKGQAKGATYAAKLSAVMSTKIKSPLILKNSRNKIARVTQIPKPDTPNTSKKSKVSEKSNRDCDMNVPVEWYRYNLIDAYDTLEYSLGRLAKLKKEANTMFLRTRSISEMQNLHKTLERLLTTASKRFGEVRENLNIGFKKYLAKKRGERSYVCDDDDEDDNDEDDDDVEILPEVNDDPIFIDENSKDSFTKDNESQEVDLTGVGSEPNDSGEKNNDLDLLEIHDISTLNRENNSVVDGKDKQNNLDETSSSMVHNNMDDNNKREDSDTDNDSEPKIKNDSEKTTDNKVESDETKIDPDETKMDCGESQVISNNTDHDDKVDEVDSENSKEDCVETEMECKGSTISQENILNCDETNKECGDNVIKNEVNGGTLEVTKDTYKDKIDEEKTLLDDEEGIDEKTLDTEMSTDMIDSLLKDDGDSDNVDKAQSCEENLEEK